MKTILKIMLIIGVLLTTIISCTKEKPTTTEISVLSDITDNHLSKPTANEIIPMFNLNESTTWNGGVFRFSEMSDVSYTRIKKTEIQPASKWLGNELERTKQLETFRRGVTMIFDEAEKDSIGKAHSSVYLTVIRELNRLADSKAQRRLLIIYSDLMENEPDDSWYAKDKWKQLQTNPDSIKSELEKKQPLNNLTGIEVFIIYQPKDIEKDKVFNTVSSFYKQILEEKGADVTIQANLVY